MILSLPIGKTSDFATLVKPRITTLVLVTTAAGLWMTPMTLSSTVIFFTLLGTCLLVGAANTLNMYLERDVDARMRRTSDRPLPARRMSPQSALYFGIGLAVAALIILLTTTNRLTFLLGIIAFVSYVLFYTPLKRKSPIALLVGAVPGALPPLMGWTAATGSIGPGGLVLFFILFLWQIPHFLAIALCHQEEYEKAGIRVLPLEKGDRTTRHWIVRYTAGLFAVSLYPLFLGMAGRSYLVPAFLLGGLFLFLGCLGLKQTTGLRWARNFFLASVIYLPLILISLVLSKTP